MTAKLKNDYLHTVLFIIFLMAFTVYDIAEDIAEGVNIEHWMHELILVLASVGFIIYKVRLAIQRDKKLSEVSQSLNNANLESEYFKRQIEGLRDGVHQLILNQFKIWGFTQSESDVALLLVKGLSMKEISEIRHSSESTIRQQSTAVYKKSGLANRSQLAAYFLEEILPKIESKTLNS